MSTSPQPPEPSWGTDVGRGYRFMRLAPWLVFIPGSVILLTTLAFNMVGDGMRDALDPRRDITILTRVHLQLVAERREHRAEELGRPSRAGD